MSEIPADTSSGKREVTQAVSPTHLRLNRILVPTDFSQPAYGALDHALGLAEQFGSSVQLVHVMEPPSPYPIVPLTHFPGDLPPYVTQELQTAGEKALEELRQAVAATVKTPVRSTFCIGRPYEEIVNTARECHADLIVISTHGYTGLQHVLLGSTAERVVRHAPCPVLVLRLQAHHPPG